MGGSENATSGGRHQDKDTRETEEEETHPDSVGGHRPRLDGHYIGEGEENDGPCSEHYAQRHLEGERCTVVN